MTYGDFMAAWIMRFGYEQVSHNDSIQFKSQFRDVLDSYSGWLMACVHMGYLSNTSKGEWRAVKNER